jgi:transposase
MAKNQIRAFLRERGVAAPKSLWTRKAQAWLKTLELEEGEAIRRDLLQDQLEESDQKLKRVDKYLNRIVDKHPGVTPLRTIPGVGPRTAEALVAYIDDARRFGSLKCAGAYFGLVPCQGASAEKNRLGHITRDGPGTVRKLLCEAACTGVRCSPTIKSYYERLMHEDLDRKKIAIVAVGHHLVRVAVSMLRTGECWRERVQVTSETEKSEAPGGGGETPSRPQGFSPPPNPPPESERISTPPPLSASPFSPQGREAGTPKTRTHRDIETVKKEETAGA